MQNQASIQTCMLIYIKMFFIAIVLPVIFIALGQVTTTFIHTSHLRFDARDLLFGVVIVWAGITELLMNCFYIFGRYWTIQSTWPDILVASLTLFVFLPWVVYLWLRKWYLAMLAIAGWYIIGIVGVETMQMNLIS